jgi:hypothetical protein
VSQSLRAKTADEAKRLLDAEGVCVIEGATGRKASQVFSAATTSSWSLRTSHGTACCTVAPRAASSA